MAYQLRDASHSGANEVGLWLESRADVHDTNYLDHWDRLFPYLVTGEPLLLVLERGLD